MGAESFEVGKRVLRERSGEIGQETYLENLSRIDQPLAVSGCICLLRDGMLEVLHGLVCLYRDL